MIFFHLDVTLTFQGLLHTVKTGSIEDIYYMLRINLIQKLEITLALYKLVDSYKAERG